MLNDRIDSDRTRAAVALGWIGNETACRALCNILADNTESPEIRRTVAETLGRVMVFVPASEFIMGSDENKDERPPQSVFVDAFYIDRYPVTNAQYERFVQETGEASPPHWDGSFCPPGLEGHPVVNVTWHQAQQFAAWCGKRLPTEAEWEKAARGIDGRRWPWGNQFDPNRCNTYDTKLDTTSPVGAFPGGDSPYGVSDMAGNVWEWTADWYGAYKKPYRPASESHTKVTRGGSCMSVKEITRCTYRHTHDPDTASEDLGFRCVTTQQPDMATSASEKTLPTRKL